MIWAIRSGALAAGAAALLSSQAVYAAPALTQRALDPLVSLSIFGTAQSRAAVCAAGTAAAGAAVAASQVMPANPACVFPVTDPAAAAVVPVEPVAVAPPPPGKGLGGMLPVLLGALLLAALAVAILSDDDENEGDLTPVSP